VFPDAVRTGWAFDERGEGRAVRVSAHVEAGFLVVSTWNADECVSTVRLLPEEAAQLVANVARALARLAAPGESDEEQGLARRVAALESRVSRLSPDS
jgi:hypothetical protein